MAATRVKRLETRKSICPRHSNRLSALVAAALALPDMPKDPRAGPRAPENERAPDRPSGRADLHSGPEADLPDGGQRLMSCMSLARGRAVRTMNREHARAAVQWLARLHAQYWGARADEAVEAGLHSDGCFWSLAASPETAACDGAGGEGGFEGRLRLAARGADWESSGGSRLGPQGAVKVGSAGRTA